MMAMTPQHGPGPQQQQHQQQQPPWLASSDLDDAAYAADAEGPAPQPISPRSPKSFSPGSSPSVASFKRQRSTKREFGLYANRLRRHDPLTTKHDETASDSEPPPRFERPRPTIHGHRTNKSSSSGGSSSMSLKQAQTIITGPIKNKFVFDFDDEDEDDKERGGQNQDGKDEESTSQESNIPRQLPPLSVLPISPRWDSLANSSTILYDQTVSPSTTISVPASTNSFSTAATSIEPSPPPPPHPHSNHPSADAAKEPFPSLNNTSPPPMAIQTLPATTYDPVDNFSRPRKPSIKQPLREGYGPNGPTGTNGTNGTNGTTHGISRLRHPDPLLLDNNMLSTQQQQQHSWPRDARERARGLSTSSKASSTYSSAAPRPSNDYLRSTRHAPPTPTSATYQSSGMISPGLPRPPAAYSRIDSNNFSNSNANPANRSATGYATGYNSNRDRDPTPWMTTDEELRDSYRSQLTSSSTAHGTLFTATGTERSSIATKTSSRTSMSWYTSGGGVGVDEGLSVEDVMGMYEKGFADSTGAEDNDLEPPLEPVRTLKQIASDFSRDSSPETQLDRFTPDFASHGIGGGGGGSGSGSFSGSTANFNEPLLLPPKITGQEPVLDGDNATLDAPYVLRDSGAFFRNSGLPSSLPNNSGLALAAQNARNRRHMQSPTADDHLPGEEQKSGGVEAVAATTATTISTTTTTTTTPTTQRPNQLHVPDDTSLIAPHANFSDSRPNSPKPPSVFPAPPRSSPSPSPSLLQPSSPAPPLTPSTSTPEKEDPNLRDRYGFRKQNQYITLAQYDAWNGPYSEYIARRRKKWVAYLKDSGLISENPNRFPPASVKTKRFVRKGIPPEWRGAAWFYYAGGPSIVAKHPGIYDRLIARAARGEAKDVDIEAIERDLHRTFPDNVKFQFPSGGEQPGHGSAASTDTGSGSSDSMAPDGSSAAPAADVTASRPNQPEIIGKLRRVLLAFSIYNPRIGYCQSLNFLAGLLLLFVKTEEQCFWLLNVITRIYLPGTHEMSLEGSKVDLSVLMTALQDSLPHVWAKIGGELDEGPVTGGQQRNQANADISRHATLGRKMKLPKVGGSRNADAAAAAAAASSADRLPPITLCMTAWFMSCFIGTLPIETTLRVWDIFFYEGSKTLFRVALAIFKLGETEIRAVADPMEMFGVVQAIPRRLVDCNMLMEATFRRRNGFGHISQENIEDKRRERRNMLTEAKKAKASAASSVRTAVTPTGERPGTAGAGAGSPRGGPKGKGKDRDRGGGALTDVEGTTAEAEHTADEMARAEAREELNAAVEVHRKGTLFGRRRERRPAAEVM